jgi:F0F1-type ATP synthase assembly protein I
MATKNAAGKPPKPTRAEKKAARKAGRTKFFETWKTLGQAFNMTRKADSRFLPLFVIVVVVGAAIGYVVPLLITGSIWIGIPFGLLIAFAAGMFIFNRRAQRMTFQQADGTPGAAAWVLQNQLRGDWRREDAVAANTQFDAVHRLIGRPGVVLVGEGSPQRVRGLIAQEKRRISRIAGDTPIYDIVVGNGDDEVPLAKLNLKLNRLPRNLSKAEVSSLDKRLQALGGRRPPMPQGPMPAGAKMRNVQRAARRHT